MNINDLMNDLNSLENNEQRLSEQINQLETERLSREQSQLRMAGQEPRPVPKSEEQVRLEQERQNMIVNKNRINSLVASYRQLETQASNTEYAGYTIQDFERLRDEYDSKRKELGDRVQALEADRLSREQSQLRMAGQEPKPIAKSEEQIKLEAEKLSAEQSFQRFVNIISLYNRLNSEIANIKEGKDMGTYLSEYSTLIYKANRAGLPVQLMVNLMGNSNVNSSQMDNQDQAQDVSKNDNSNPEVVAAHNNKPEENQTIETPAVSSNQSISREQEIYDELAASAKRLKEAMLAGDDNAIAVERSHRQQLLSELQQIKEAETKKMKDEQIAKVEKLLEESNKRLKEAMESGDENAIASERSYRQQLLNKIAEIKGVKITEPVKAAPAITPIEETDNVEKEDEIDEEIESVDEENEIEEEQEIEDNQQEEIDEEYDLTDEEIRNKITELEKERKEIDDKLIKIDLNAPWEGTPELMREFIEKGKDIERYKSMLPDEIKEQKEEEQKVEETIEEPIEEKVETPVEEEKIEEKIEDKIEEKEETKKRTPKFKKFLKKILPKWMIRVGFAAKRALSKIFTPTEEIEVDDNVINTPIDEKVEIPVEEEIEPISDEEVIEEDDDKTIDFTAESKEIEENIATIKDKDELERIKEELKGYSEEIESTLNKGRSMA